MEPIFTGTIPPRYTKNDFPPYRHLPALTPHPLRDPRGHSYGEKKRYLSRFSGEDWKNCPAYLYGIDLFNHGYWWEAHEAFEQVWLAAGRETLPGIFMQGLIQIAVAQLKRFMGKERGARMLTASGVAKLSVAQGIYLGIEVALLIAEAERNRREDRGEYPRIRLTFHP